MEDQVQVQSVSVEIVRGERGEIGEASASQTVKKMWKGAGQHISLKSFVRKSLANKDDASAILKEWFLNKKGTKNTGRSEQNTKRVELERQASKSARKKMGQGKNKATTTTTTTTAGVK